MFLLLCDLGFFHHLVDSRVDSGGLGFFGGFVPDNFAGHMLLGRFWGIELSGNFGIEFG